MHKHHRPLGLAIPQDGARGGVDIAMTRPVHPVTLLRPHAARRAARFFVERFAGRSLYGAVFDSLPAGDYTLWLDDQPLRRNVAVAGAAVTDISIKEEHE